MQLTGRTRFLTTVAVVAATGLGLTSLTTAAGAATTTDSPTREARIQRACARIPDLAERVDDHIATIEGDADTPGSLARLQQRIDAARAAGHDQKADALEIRRTVRTERLELLKVRADALDELQALCDEHVAPS